MHLHAALRDDASFIGTLKRQLSRRGSIKKQNRERSGSTTTGGAKPSLLYLDMSQHVDWEARTELPFLDEAATRPAQTTLLLEIPELQGICVNHGERHIRIERREAITVRDVLIELDKFLHRPAPKLVGNFKTVKVTVDADADALVEQPRSPKAIDLEVSESPDSSESSLSSQGEKKPRESVLKSWMEGKTMFAGLRQAENHDFKLYVRMVKPSKESSPHA